MSRTPMHEDSPDHASTRAPSPVDAIPSGDERASAPSAPSAGADLPALTGLRFVAAAAVVLYHADTFTALLPDALSRLSRAGFAAVGLFYVLSGFLLARRWGARFAEGTAQAGPFLRARLARIAPLHLVGVAWSYVLFRHADWPAGVIALPVATALLGLHAWHPPFVFQTNVPSWSVSNEAFFYLAFPLLARRLVGGASRARTWSILGFAWLLGLAPGVWILAHPDVDSAFVRLSPITRLPEFVMGMALGRLYVLGEFENLSRRVSDGLALGAMVGWLVAAWFVHALPYALFHNALLAPLFGALVLGLARGGRGSATLGSPTLVRLGEMSFALYIFQEPLKQTLTRVVRYVGTPVEVVTGHLVFFTVLVGVAWLAWRLVEGPARRAILGARRATLGALGVLLVLVALALAAFGLHHRRTPLLVAAGNFQRIRGCASDWSPACERTAMRRVAGDALTLDTQVYALSLPLPAGHWELKIATEASWHASVGAGGRGGGNVVFDLREPAVVEVLYARGSEWVTTSANGPIVTLPGSFQRDVGCAADWSPECLETWMQDVDGDGVFVWETRALSAGRRAVKVALGRSWATNFGADGAPAGPNVAFEVPRDGAPMRFAWDARTHRLTVTSR